MATKGDITESIHDELSTRFVRGYDNDNVVDAIEFITRALGNFFNTDQLEEFYEFLKDE